jgi:hypothetical protein
MGPAMALVEFLREHPARPATRWSPDDDGVLRGTVYGPQAGGESAVRWYVEALGASPVARHRYEYDGRVLRVVEVAAVWRDVRVVVEVSVEERPVLVPTEIRMGDGQAVDAREWSAVAA